MVLDRLAMDWWRLGMGWADIGLSLTWAGVAIC